MWMKFLLTGVQNWKLFWPMKKLLMEKVNVEDIQLFVNQCVNGYWKSPNMQNVYWMTWSYWIGHLQLLKCKRTGLVNPLELMLSLKSMDMIKNLLYLQRVVILYLGQHIVYCHQNTHLSMPLQPQYKRQRLMNINVFVLLSQI